MKPPKRNKRLVYLALTGSALTAAAFLMFSALSQNVSYFYSPVQIENGEADGQAQIRLGGLVADGSITRGEGTMTTFIVTDGAANVVVQYNGILPDLFREGQGVIAQGKFDTNHVFIAQTILAKHDENYKPKELVEALESAEKHIKTDKKSDNIHLPKQHVSKKYINQSCSQLTLKTGSQITGAAFLTPGEDQKTVFLAISNGPRGTSLYNSEGKSVWKSNEQADIVSSFGGTMLIYREDKVASTLERFTVDTFGTVSSISIESPSEIAPTTLQRTTYSSLGPVLFKDNGILLETSFIKLGSRPTALAATASTFGSEVKGGTVAIGLKNGNVEIWAKSSTSAGCK